MIGIRQKILLGFSGLLVIIAVIGLLTLDQIDHLGNAIDIILKENYRSVIASQKMKEALEKIDNDILNAFAGKQQPDTEDIGQNEQKFRDALKLELGNITLPGEGEKATRVAQLFDSYVKILHQVSDSSIPVQTRWSSYNSTLLPLLSEIKALAQQILDMNQANMNDANNAARRMSNSAHNSILAAILACALISVLFSFQSRRWILQPIRKLIASANEIKNGHFELVIEKESNDEIGLLSEAFNDMAQTLRQVKKNDDETLQRTRLATQEVMNLLPTPIAIIDTEGIVTVSTLSADKFFGLRPDKKVSTLDYPWLSDMISRSISEGRTVEAEEKRYIQCFINNQEYFYQPVVAPVPPFQKTGKIIGTLLLFKDITQAHEQKELKRSVVSTVSHQLRTPLTSLRMSIHLLLEEKIGSLNEKQNELLVAAREDSERLTGILDDLLDLNRIESGKDRLNILALQPATIIKKGIEPFLLDARDKGVSIVTDLADSLPDVHADMASMQHIFANLMTNAIRFTPPGGTITVRAFPENSAVRFSVEDTGAGIAPEHLQHIFEQFYQVPGQQSKSGAGLGLAIVKEMIEAQGGTAGAASTPGKGSEFYIELSSRKT
ncbi:MAG: HAMP domain-containing protein [Chlorobium sp.]|nr:MAG: HAMP domain-containing protein [Chlorobium sp.]